MSVRRNFLAATLAVVACACALPASATSTNAAPVAPVPPPLAKPIRTVDADGHTVQLNRPGMITVIVGTNEDSQDAARVAGKVMYPFQGRPDFGLIVVVDLRHTIASWVPSMVISRMKVSLDQEVFELKPYYLKNGNHNNPRSSSHVIPDFSGTICPQLSWKEGVEKLRVIIFGVDGNEIERLDNLEIADMPKVQEDVRKAIQAQVVVEQAKVAAEGKPPPWRQPLPRQHPPIVPYTPYAEPK